MDALRFVGDSQSTVEGLLVPYGGAFNGRDSYGTYATRDTEFCLDWFTERPFLYHHGLDGEIRVDPIGRITSLEVRDAGVWMQAQLDEHNAYVEDIKKLIAAGALGLSSGAMAHLVEIDEATGEWKRWPIVEGSATPTPSNLLATIDNHAFASACRSAGFEEIAEKVGDSEILQGTRAPQSDPATRANAGTDVVEYERSFEDIRSDIEDLLNPSIRFEVWGTHWNSVLATYSDSVIVARYCEYPDCCEDDPSYWKIAYTLDENNEPVLGASQQMEQVYLPVARAAGPLSMDAQSLTRQAAAFTERTKDLCTRRVQEGRPLSAGNRAALARVLHEMQTATQGMDTLLVDSTRAAEQQAKASDPQTWTGQLAELELLSLLTD